MAAATAPPPGGSRGFFLRQRQRPRQARWRWRAARSVTHSARSQGVETEREGGGRGTGGLLGPSHRPLREGHRGAAWGRAAPERDGRGRGNGRKDSPRPSAGPPGQGAGLGVQGAGRPRSGWGSGGREAGARSGFQSGRDLAGQEWWGGAGVGGGLVRTGEGVDGRGNEVCNLVQMGE